jgi:hypothetical protein
MEAVPTFKVRPGASLPLHLTVTNKNTGALENLDGAAVEAVLRDVVGEAAAIAPSQVDGNTWLVNVGTGETVANRGRVLWLEVFITPAAALETTAIEAKIIVGR